jgi:hypothetical protein
MKILIGLLLHQETGQVIIKTRHVLQTRSIKRSTRWSSSLLGQSKDLAVARKGASRSKAFTTFAQESWHGANYLHRMHTKVVVPNLRQSFLDQYVPLQVESISQGHFSQTQAVTAS